MSNAVTTPGQFDELDLLSLSRNDVVIDLPVARSPRAALGSTTERSVAGSPRGQRLTKRAFGQAVAGIGLIVLTPAFLTILLAVRLRSKAATDDLPMSPAIEVLSRMRAQGAQVRVRPGGPQAPGRAARRRAGRRRLSTRRGARGAGGADRVGRVSLGSSSTSPPSSWPPRSCRRPQSPRPQPPAPGGFTHRRMGR